VGLFALCHGHAHGTEMPARVSGLAYAAGFMLTTSLLHLAGIGLGITLQKTTRPLVIRWAGGALALAGIYLML
jgi:urease accessory protein